MVKDLIDRQKAIEYYRCTDPAGTFAYCESIIEFLEGLPAEQPDYKTDHGYMWLCPECGLEVHSDFRKCVRCGWNREAAQQKTQLSEEGATSDCISRQAAIDALTDYIHNVDKVMGAGRLPLEDCRDAAESVLGEVPSAQPETPKQNTETAQFVPNGDLISRKTAIYTVRNFEDCENGYSGTYDKSFIISALEELPPAQPEQPVYCKDCIKHNKGMYDTTRMDEECPLVYYRGEAKGHEFDYQYCVYGKRTEEGDE